MGYPQGVWKIENQFVFIANINSTVEPRLSGLVATSVKSQNNRKYEY